MLTDMALEMEALCTTCLNSGRNLYVLADTELFKIYEQILNEISASQCEGSVLVRVCWECRAILRRFQRFKVQAQGCYRELLRHAHQQTSCLRRPERISLQVHQVHNSSYPVVKEEPDSLSLDNDGHEELETVAYDLVLDKDSLINGQTRKSTQTHKTKVKKKVKLRKGRARRGTQLPPGPPSDGGSDGRLSGDCFELEDMQADIKHEVRYSPTPIDSSPRARSVKQEATEQPDVKSERDEVHEEPETVAYDLAVDKDSKGDRQTQKTKVKKKVKLKKSKSRKEEPQVPQEPPGAPGDPPWGAPGDGAEGGDTDVKVGPEGGTAKGGRRARSREALPERPTCADCGKTFSSRKTFRYHRNVLHKGQNRYPCPRCSRVYQWKSNLGRHMRTHKARDTGELYCEACDKSFASVATYRQHLRISRKHVPETDYSFMCNECGKKFVDKTRLRDHIDWEHLKKIKYRCQICNNAFKCHTTLYVHMQNIHTNKERKENLCHVCGKSYQNASKLKYHIVAMHTSETPHRCAHCGAAFGWYSSLYRHTREVHYGMKVATKAVKKSKLLRDLLQRPAP